MNDEVLDDNLDEDNEKDRLVIGVGKCFHGGT